MPSCITHQIIAERAREHFPPNVCVAAKAHNDYFFLGAQGPDVFFFLSPLSKKEYNLGKHMHRYGIYETFSFFQSYMQTLLGEERERVWAYLSGFVCHYATDTAFHPFVYAYLESHGNRGMAHQLIETDWDVYFARQEGKRAAGWKFPFSAKKIAREGTLYRLYAAFSEALGRRKLKAKTFKKGIKSFSRYLKFFHGKSHQKGWARTEKILHLKPRLSCLYPRENPDKSYLEGEEFSKLAKGRGETADELKALAVSESARLCGLFFEGTLPESEFNKSFLSGESVE